MKLFSLKKDNNSSATKTNEANQPIEQAEYKVTSASNNPLQFGETVSKSMSMSVQTPTASDTPKDSDVFSLDTIDLNKLEDELLHGKTDYTADNKTADNTAQKDISFDDFNLDELLNDFDPKTTADAVTTSQPVLAQPTQPEKTDDALSVDVNNVAQQAVQQTIQPKSIAYENITDTTPAVVLAKNNADIDAVVEYSETAGNLDVALTPVQDTKIDTHDESSPSDNKNDLVAAAVPNPLLKSPNKPSAKLPLKKSNRLGLLLGAGLVLAALAWLFLGQSNEPSQSTVQTQTKAQTTPKPKSNAVPAMAAPVVKPQASATLPVASVAVVDETTSSTAQATAAVPTITPEEILKPTLPEDPAIAKEEMSRLSDQSAQLKEQEAMMQEQLRMMNELSSKKAERIKLLEQQVTHLEQQKAANK